MKYFQGECNVTKLFTLMTYEVKNLDEQVFISSAEMIHSAQFSRNLFLVSLVNNLGQITLVSFAVRAMIFAWF